MQTLAEHARRTQDAFTSSREAGLKVAHTLAQNYATLVSGGGVIRSDATRQAKEVGSNEIAGQLSRSGRALGKA
jgi:hypothetical protein